MSVSEKVPMVRCRLDGIEESPAQTLRYIPLSEFGLWRYLMETRHRRRVTVEEVSVWFAEEAARWNAAFAAEELEPVVRVCFEGPGPSGATVPVERYFPAESYPEAQEALLHHFDGVPHQALHSSPGYFVPVRALRTQALPTPA